MRNLIVQKKILKVPYIGKPCTEYKKKIEKLLNSYIENFKVIFITLKIRGNYFSNKDKTPDELKSNVVYEYKCSKDMGIQYIGFTSRRLIESKSKTAVSDHISNCNICKDERIIVNNFDILKECINKLETMISEAILIKRHTYKKVQLKNMEL